MTKKEVLDAAARGEGCLGRSADDEPVFVIVARDVCSTNSVLSWAKEAARLDVPFAKITGAIDDAAAMLAWRQKHGGGKVPD